MGALNLTIQVQNVDPTVTAAELVTYFSYCGTVDKIQLQRNDDETQSAQVTFRAPFAFRTALLLDNAMVARQPIRVSPSEDSTKDIHAILLEGDTKDDQEQAQLVPVVLCPSEA
ncbi:RRM domain-containing protein, partial [Psidium guajava]